MEEQGKTLPFGGYILAKHQEGYSYTTSIMPVLLYRASRAEALLSARDLAYQEFPPEKGFYGHHYEVIGPTGEV